MNHSLTVCFYTSDQWISRFIRWLTKSKFSHVAIGAIWHDVPVIVHSTIGGVQITPRRRYERSERLVEERGLGASWQVEGRDALLLAIETVGIRYDYPNAIWRAKAILAWRWFSIKIKKPHRSVRAQVCSEFVVRLRHWSWANLDAEIANAQDVWQAVDRADLSVIFDKKHAIQ